VCELLVGYGVLDCAFQLMLFTQLSHPFADYSFNAVVSVFISLQGFVFVDNLARNARFLELAPPVFNLIEVYTVPGQRKERM